MCESMNEMRRSALDAERLWTRTLLFESLISTRLEIAARIVDNELLLQRCSADVNL